MDAISVLIGAAAIIAIAAFSAKAARAQNEMQQKCSRLDSCQTREKDILMKKPRGR